MIPKVETSVHQYVIPANNLSKRVTISVSLEIAQLLTQFSEDQLRTVLGKIVVYEKYRGHKKSKGTGNSVQTLRQIREEE
ncbi:hypothetical protein [Candidatus Marithrix sp. Canyon 246]|jgi:hypothetical protein|uniref:hypothetical protein n=1 Tax=Candidatus Marithrix sp. Canyon 246 TaxID=1827136 RepID=UPI00084A1DF7|nr:hypothetical protein [Candidatus Marithrix sp. Canyon 246]